MPESSHSQRVDKAVDPANISRASQLAKGVLAMSKRWVRPQLLVLYRGEPEERLLGRTYCKTTQPKNLPDRAVAIICQFDQGGRAGVACYDYLLS